MANGKSVQQPAIQSGSQSSMWPGDNPAVMAHITLLQGVINRLATQSSSSKTWCLTLVAALISFAGATKIPGIVTFALVPVLVFGFLDTMYLAQEKAYRDLFGSIAELVRDGKYGRDQLFSASAPVSSKHVFHALRSWSIWPVYGGLLAGYVIAQRSEWLAALSMMPR
jgi:hypothetical protein